MLPDRGFLPAGRSIMLASVQRRERILGFTEAIWRWYRVRKRTLPWRDLPLKDDTERAYRVLVSEVMLQQTQVPRVIILYPRFLDRFPTVATLARASNADVIRAWRGMGYNSRALRLRDACKTVLERHGGVFPREMEELQAVKGLGHYTAAAVRNFAFNAPTPCIDTNIRRILHRTFVGPENADGSWAKDDRFLLTIAAAVLEAAMDGRPDHDARNWHAALMDFGSLVQTKRNPQWDLCPLTAQGLMKATGVNFPKSEVRIPKSEPGRIITGRFVPNRIVRGRIVEALRDQPSGLSLDELGRRVAADWSAVLHRRWLENILSRLQHDALVMANEQRFLLAEDITSKDRAGPSGRR